MDGGSTIPKYREQINELSQIEKEKQMSEITPQAHALDCVARHLFIVGSVDTEGNTSFSANPVIHDTSISARVECKRLAKMFPGKVFIFVQLAGGELIPSTSISV